MSISPLARDVAVARPGMRFAETAMRPWRVNTILASIDSVAIDAVGSQMLGHKSASIEYLRLANGRLVSTDDIEILGASVQGQV